MNQTKGMLITFEGNDGAGKTTALESVAAILKEKGYPIVVSREPGGSVLAEKIRELILDVNNEMDAKTEAYLYAASRREHLVQTILPALQEGKLILCDRYLDSSLAYQGHGRKLGQKEIEQLNDFGLEGFRPDYTLFFSLDLETEKERMEMRGEMNRLDLESREFHQRVRDGFTCLCQQNPQRIHVIDASQTKEEVAQATLALVEELWEGRLHD